MRAVNGSFPQARWVPVSLATINRLLIPTGLHQVLNTIARFQIGGIHHRRHCIPRRYQPLLCWRRHGGDVYVRLLPRHDVWSAGRRSGDVFRRAGTSSDGGRYAAVCRDHRVSDRRNRAAGILFTCSTAPLLYLPAPF